MSKDSNTQHRATRQHPPTKIIVERHYVGTEKMETDIAERLNLQMLSARFDNEQEELTTKIKELEKSAITDKKQLSSIISILSILTHIHSHRNSRHSYTIAEYSVIRLFS